MDIFGGDDALFYKYNGDILKVMIILQKLAKFTSLTQHFSLILHYLEGITSKNKDVSTAKQQ